MRLKTLLVAFWVIIALQACKKESAHVQPVIPEKEKLSTMEEKRVYLRYYLKSGGNDIAKALENIAFKNALLDVLHKPENENHEITFKEILNNSSLKGYVNGIALQKSIDAFQDLDGKDWSPSIRLMKPETTVQPITVFDANSSNNFTDFFAINEGWPEHEMPSIPALEYINGELWPVDDFYLTEQNIYNQPVWVLELDDIGLDAVTSNPPLFGPQTCTNSNEPTFKSSISTMTVKQRKEHWLAGNSDVHIMRGTTWRTPNFTPNSISNIPEVWNLGKTRKYKTYQGQTQVEYCIADEDGDRIGRFHHNRDIKRQRSVPVNFELIKSWKPNFGSDQDVFTYLGCNKATCVIRGNIMYYVIFERDAWPAPVRTVSIPNPVAQAAQPMRINFRSWDGYYTKGFIDYVRPDGPALPTNIKGYHIKENSIEFRTKIN
jgi:hypothetical protein